MFIPREQLNRLKKLLSPGKVVILYGARRVGKTTLVRKLLEELEQEPTFRNNILFLSADDIISRQYLESQSVIKLKELIGIKKLLIVDEAQYIDNVGLNLKLIVDHISDVRVIATGSSSFKLSHHIEEPLTGRKFELKLYPIAQMELSRIENRAETVARLENRLIYGSYPEIITARDNEMRQYLLREIVNSYLFKDILELNGVRRSSKLLGLLQLLAFQIGKTVSHAELGTQLGINKNTVERYLDLLQQTFVIFRLGGFSRNLRKEITKNSKYYFWDTGIRNAIIQNFNPLNLRNDVGELWENYIIAERSKYCEYRYPFYNLYFWRTYDRTEIALVEEREGKLFAYEIKWREGKTVKPPALWKQAYPEASFQVITRENYLRFIT